MDQTDKNLTDEAKTDDSGLSGWVMGRVDRWRQHRDKNYKSDWDTYWAIFTGKWDPMLKVKQAERSRIIAPATQNAIDQTVSEMVEATFGRGKWFDINDENPQLQSAATTMRDNLIDDFDRDRVVNTVIDVYYNGAIFGTGIAKRVIERGPVNRVYWAAIRPQDFVIDTAAFTVDDALGVAHETVRPRHEIEQKQQSKEYREGDLGSGSMPNQARGSSSTQFDLLQGFSGDQSADGSDGVYITEYHGLVPADLLKDATPAQPDADILAETQDDEDSDETVYVEAIVLIANGSLVLKATQNPITDSTGKPDRGFVSYQHHKCPSSFWGIGQAQKALNAQIGLDSELRARADTLALTTYPMVGADATRLPKNMRLAVEPGKLILTNGKPSEVIEGLRLGQLDPVSFQQSSEYERMVQMSTGANDPSKAINPSAQNTTAAGASMQATGFIKRAKLTMQNVDTDFLDPLVRKTLFAYMKVSPQRYPQEVSFNVNSTMSIMAREFEQAQMTNLLAIIPQQSPAFNVILRSIVENYSGPSKDKMLQAIDQMSQPNPQAEQMKQQQDSLQMAHLQKSVELLDAQVMEMKSRVPVNQAKAQHEQQAAALAPVEARIQAVQAHTGQVQAAVAARNADTSEKKIHADVLKEHIKGHYRPKPQPTQGA